MTGFSLDPKKLNGLVLYYGRMVERTGVARVNIKLDERSQRGLIQAFTSNGYLVMLGDDRLVISK